MPETKGRSLDEIEMAFREETMGAQARQKIYSGLFQLKNLRNTGETRVSSGGMEQP